MSLRIIAGAWRGRVLKTPTGVGTRPTSDRLREALFSMLSSRIGAFEGLLVADLFAGTGALGLEALSRGAELCTFVEHDANAIAALRANIAMLGAKGEVRQQSVASLGPSTIAYDLLLFDPPYGTGGAGALIERLTRLGWVAAAAWTSVETAREEDVRANGWDVEAERIHGKGKITLLRRVSG